MYLELFWGSCGYKDNHTVTILFFFCLIDDETVLMACTFFFACFDLVLYCSWLLIRGSFQEYQGNTRVKGCENPWGPTILWPVTSEHGYGNPIGGNFHSFPEMSMLLWRVPFLYLSFKCGLCTVWCIALSSMHDRPNFLKFKRVINPRTQNIPFI